MAAESIFSEEWRECLRAQYMAVIRQNDTVTLSTLKDVMAQVGFTEAELSDLYLRATMRADEHPDDFIPNAAFAVPSVALEPDSLSADEPPLDDPVDSSLDIALDDESLEPDEIAPDDVGAAFADESDDTDSAPPDADPGPLQLSLF